MFRFFQINLSKTNWNKLDQMWIVMYFITKLSFNFLNINQFVRKRKEKQCASTHTHWQVWMAGREMDGDDSMERYFR